MVMAIVAKPNAIQLPRKFSGQNKNRFVFFNFFIMQSLCEKTLQLDNDVERLRLLISKIILKIQFSSKFVFDLVNGALSSF